MTVANAELRARQWIHRSPVPLPDLAFQHILAAILRGEYSSGDRLTTARFADELHMSMNPIREAIIRLRDIGLVDVTPARYTKVADFAAPGSRAAISYAGVLAGAALRNALPTVTEGVRSDLATYADTIAAAEGATGTTAMVVFLDAVADVMEHPRQSMHLVETTILAQCALQFSGAHSDDDATTVPPSAARAVAQAIRAADGVATENAVRALFDLLA